MVPGDVWGKDTSLILFFEERSVIGRPSKSEIIPRSWGFGVLGFWGFELSEPALRKLFALFYLGDAP